MLSMTTSLPKLFPSDCITLQSAEGENGKNGAHYELEICEGGGWPGLLTPFFLCKFYEIKICFKDLNLLPMF